MHASPTFTLDQLCTLSDITKRTVRYYMQIGLLDRPIGETKAAHYLPKHLEQLLRIRQLSDAGVSLERIRDVLSGEASPVPPRQRKPGSVDVRSHLFVAPGIELQISPEEAGITPEQLRALVGALMRAAEEVMGSSSMPTSKPNDHKTTLLKPKANQEEK
jgi:DNA-binding transcriptional MerR regulator